MKAAAAGLVGMIVALAPVARAQVACPEIQQTITYARDDFQDILGEEMGAGTDIYAASFELSGAGACTVGFDIDSYYRCLWTLGSDADAKAAYDALANAVSDCLWDWSTIPIFDAPTLPDGTVSYSVRSGSGDLEDMEVVVHLDRFADDAGQVQWELWYDLAYYLR